MSSRHADSAQNVGEGGTGTGGAGSAAAPPPDPSADQNSANTVIKSGPLFISSKGIGWTSWKKRWFILSRTSLVFFRSDPSAVPQKGSEANLTLGGIDLNNSGSVVVKADKKLLTVLFPDGGRDGRAFTLKAETLDDLYEWKAALENALAQAPNAAAVTGQNGLLKNEPDTKNGSSEQTKDRQPAKSTVIGRPVLLALEEVDGSPSFLEKAMRFIEGDGVRVEGILRQAADVEHVERRIREYEEGKTEFTAEEDAHVIADCIKYIIRELPSYPVPASCCNALLEACRKSAGGDRATRVNAMRVAICETFPEPNRRLLQRILTMMQIVASHKNENLMSPSAVAACMAPLLLRPLMAGDCEIENDFDVGADSSMQLLQAAAAANHAQAICITLLEEYNKIFGEGSISPELYSNSEESGSESEEATEDDDESYDDGTGESDVEIYSDDDLENGSSGTCSESCDSGDYDDEQDLDGSGSGSKSPEVNDGHKSHQKLSSSSLKKSLPRRRGDGQERENVPDRVNNSPAIKFDESAKLQDDSTNRSSVNESNDRNQVAMIQKSKTLAFGPLPSKRHPANWGRASARKNLSMESIDYDLEDENDVHKLEASKADLQNRVAKEVKGNEILQASLDKRNKALHEHRLDLEQEVANLREQLQKERDARTAMEAVLKNPLGPLPNLSSVDEKTKAKIRELAQTESDVANLKQTVDDLGMMLKHEQTHSSASDSGHRKKNTKASSNQHHERSSKGSHMEGAATDHENKANKDSSQNQQSGSHNSTSRSVGMAANSSAHESAVGKHTQGNFKRSTTRGDGGTTNALTKLTTRLNFLKERRSQIASELQNIEKGRGSGQSGVKNLENRIVSAFQSDHNNPERGRW